jgi:PKD repeat protein
MEYLATISHGRTGAQTQGITVSPTATSYYVVTVTDAIGCTAFDEVAVIVSPASNLTVDLGPDMNMCDYSSYTITANASGGTGTYYYNWSTSETTQSISVYSTGTYSVTVSDGAGSVSDSVTIIYIQQPMAEFFYDIVGNTVTFENFSTSTQYCSWNFGNGFFSNLVSPVYTYPTGGFYNVCLTIIDSAAAPCNTTVTYCQPIGIDTNANSCLADFSYSMAGNTMDMYNYSLGSITHYYWDFGNGYTSSQQNPSYTYPHAGYYRIKLTVTDSVNQCMDSKEIILMVGTADDCEAEFQVYSDLSNNTVYFFDLSHGDSLDTYIWNFGDGQTSTDRDPVYVYTASGYYNVCLTAASSQTGCANISCQTVRAGDDAQSCYTSFIFSVDSTGSKAGNGRRVDFKGSAYGDPAKAEWDVLWEFGDGNTYTTDLNPRYEYADTGIYLVHLQIQSSSCLSHYFALVNLEENTHQVLGAFGYLVDSTNNKAGQHPVDFRGATYGDPAIVVWNFGDGDTDSTSLYPTHEYADTGVYVVCMTVSEPLAGASYEYCDSIYVEESASGIENGYIFKQTLHVFPNPTLDVAYILIPESGEIRMMDLQGRLLRTQKVNSGLLRIETLTPGMYLLDFITRCFG